MIYGGTKTNIEVNGWLYQTKTNITHIVYQPFPRVMPPKYIALVSIVSPSSLGFFCVLLDRDRIRIDKMNPMTDIQGLVKGWYTIWVKCVLVWYSQPLTSMFGLVNRSIKKMRMECCLQLSHSKQPTKSQNKQS